MYKKLIFSTWLLSMLCVANISFGMDVSNAISLDPQNTYIGWYNESHESMVFVNVATSEEEIAIPTKIQSVKKYNCKAHSSKNNNNTIILKPNQLSDKYQLPLILKPLVHANIQKTLKDNKTSLQLYYEFDDKKLFLELNNGIKDFDTETSPFPAGKPTQQSAPRHSTTKPKNPISSNTRNSNDIIVASLHNIKIKQNASWINPIDCTENKKIYINAQNGDIVYQNCAATLDLKNNHLTITEKNKTLIVIDISNFHDTAKQLIQEASEKVLTQIWYSLNQDASKEIFTITSTKIINTKKEDNSETPRFDSTPWWQNKVIIIGGIALTGMFLYFLIMHLRK
jgi:hypothetical protein